MTDFRLDGLSDDEIDDFIVVQKTDEWRSAENDQIQVAIVAQALHFDP
jgi:hypothetical protein